MYGPKPRPLHERFWSRVTKGRRSQDCWKWSGANVGGYGVIGSGGRKSRSLRANRVSWELHFGPIPSGMHVCHRCDNPGCTNPKHLFIGTAQDNAIDRVEKGRSAPPHLTRHIGESNGKSKLTEADVRNILNREEVWPGMSRSQIARMLQVSVGAIDAVISRRNWKHISLSMGGE